jgi:glycosyltransferase involved in cell wall biosynthesis
MARVVLDITRLLTRIGHEVATGVDRVELAHAVRLLDSDKHETTFAAIVSGRARALDTRIVEPLIRRLVARWGRAGSGSARVMTARFLGIEPAMLTREQSETPLVRAQGFGRRVGLRTLVAALRTQALANGDRKLAQLADQRVIYLHLSHLRLDHRPPFARLARQHKFRLVIFLHDLIPLSFPEYSRPQEAERHARRLSTAIELAESFAVNSADTRDSLIEYAEAHGLQSPPIMVAPLGIEPLFQAAPAAADLPPYFVTVGTIEPRKNHLLLLHLWRKLGAEHKQPPKLLVVGRRGWENENIVDVLERSHSVRAHVLETNDLPDDTLGMVIAGARALLFPSFAEGYGLPLVESLTLGTPVIASDLPVFREVGQGVPDFLDPLDGRAWGEAILDYARPDSARRAAQMQRLQAYRPPSWDDHFAAVDQLLTD